MERFNVTDYGEVFAAVLSPERSVAIDSGTPDHEQLPRLQDLTIEKAFAGRDLQDASQAACCISAVWLYHDFLDQSHQISQHIKTSSGSFWHGIMHRREGDFSNAKYWFRQVDGHVVYESIAAAAETALANHDDQATIRKLIGQGEWDPFLFVDLCQQAVGRDASMVSLCRELTHMEWQLLFDYCYQQACR